MSVPPNERPTAQQLRDGITEPVTIAGKPADVCPFCGCALFVDRTNTLPTTIERHVYCRNASCGKGFLSRQPPAIIVREINQHDKISSSGKHRLTLHRESA